MNLVFANRDDDDAMYPLTTREIAEAQKHDLELNKMTDKYGYTIQLVKNTKVLCKNGIMVIPTSLQQRAVAWYHHYLQQPGNTCLEETLHLSMYWKGLRKTVQSHNFSWNCCHFLNHLHDISYAYETAYRRLSSLPCKLSAQNLSLCILSDLNGACLQFRFFVCFLHPHSF